MSLMVRAVPSSLPIQQSGPAHQAATASRRNAFQHFLRFIGPARSTITDANGITEGYGFDMLNRLTSRVNHLDGIPEFWVYSTNGLSSYTNYESQIAYYFLGVSGLAARFGHDAAGRLTAITNENSEVTRFGYDPAGNLTNLTDGLGRSNLGITTSLAGSRTRLPPPWPSGPLLSPMMRMATLPTAGCPRPEIRATRMTLSAT